MGSVDKKYVYFLNITTKRGDKCNVISVDEKLINLKRIRALEKTLAYELCVDIVTITHITLLDDNYGEDIADVSNTGDNVEIITPATKVLFHCGTCGCEFKVLKSDAKLQQRSSHVSGRVYLTTCPECGTNISNTCAHAYDHLNKGSDL